MTEQIHDCIVIGAGFAGVTAARDLAENGYDVLVLEGRDRLGGRTWYRRFPGTERDVEYGGTWFSTDWMPSLAREVERYGIGLVDQSEPQSFVWALAGLRRSGAPLNAAEFEASESLIAALHVAMAAMPGGILIPGVDYSEWDVPVTAWPPVRDAPETVRAFVCAWASMYAGCAPEEVSVLHYVRIFAEFGDSVTSLYSGLAQKFEHGTRELIDSMAAAVAPRIEFDVTVTRVHDDGETVHVEAGDAEYLARRVISTIPLNVLPSVAFVPPLPGAELSAVATGHPCRSIKVWARVRNIPRGLFGLGWPSAIQWLSDEYPLGDGTSLVVGFGYDENALTDVAIEEAIRFYAPEVEVISIDRHDWSDDRHSNGAWSVWGPGWFTDGHVVAFNRPHGRIHFAGSDLASTWPGWIAGAISSGADAAAAVSAALVAVRSPLQYPASLA